ncbi:hypothetical protein DFH09DRAFT_1342777 [Mycena vulgaris]|nr:hypothetical protein DFH09DRAFT_1342777 [Mycena vulgaris]
MLALVICYARDFPPILQSSYRNYGPTNYYRITRLRYLDESTANNAPLALPPDLPVLNMHGTADALLGAWRAWLKRTQSDAWKHTGGDGGPVGRAILE